MVLNRSVKVAGMRESIDSSLDCDAKLQDCIISSIYTAVLSSSSRGFWRVRYSLRMFRLLVVWSAFACSRNDLND